MVYSQIISIIGVYLKFSDHNYITMTDKKILEVQNVNDSLIFVWGTDENPIDIDYNDWTEEQKNAWKIVSDLLVSL